MDDTIVFEIEILEPLGDQDFSVTSDGQIIELFDLSLYVSTLNQEDKLRYAAKLLIVGYDCSFVQFTKSIGAMNLASQKKCLI
jgi:hypothetical protein